MLLDDVILGGRACLLAVFLVSPRPVLAVFTYQGCPDNPSRLDTLKSTQFREVVLVSRGNTNPAALVRDASLIEPVGMYVHTDGRVYWTERTNATGQPNTTTATARVRVFNPANLSVRTVAVFNVATGVGSGQVGNRELGLRYLTFDPDYAANHWVYVMYMPRTSVAARGIDTMLVSRFTMPTLDTLDPSSEKKLLKMPWNPGICCHQGGAMDWDAQGNLYITTGNNAENSNNFGPMRDNYPRIGAPKDSATQDNAARTANTLDWRGKVLRIRPDGSAQGYSIPPGNLRQRLYEIGGAWVADQDTNRILPEIYSFGHRNAYSIHVDRVTGWVTVGEVGPDAGSTTSNPGNGNAWGPAGREEWNVIRQPGFFGFPYFIGDNKAYGMWDTASNTSANNYTRPPQNPDSVYNNSRSNTGIRKLPQATACVVCESKQSSENPASYNFGSGTSAATTGPFVHYNGGLASPIKLPPHLDGKWIIAESGGGRNWVKIVTLNGAGTAIAAIDSFPGGTRVIKPQAPSGGYGVMDMKIGPDGALYLAHYASANFNSTDSTRISRIEYTGGCLPAVSSSVSSERRPVREVLYSSVGGRLIWPVGMRRAEVFNLQGRLIWSHERDAASEAVTLLPESPRSGVFRVRFRP